MTTRNSDPRGASYVDLAIPLAADKLFTYMVPEELRDLVRAGVRAVAPLGNRNVIGFIAGTRSDSPIRNVKLILDVIDAEPVISEELLNLSRWISDYYIVPWGAVLKSFLVQGSANAGRRRVKLLRNDGEELLPRQRAVVDHLAKGGEATIRHLQKILKVKNINQTVNELSRRGILHIEEQPPHGGIKPKYEQTIEITPSARQMWQENLITSGTRARGQVGILEDLLTTTDKEIGVREFLKKSGRSLSSLKTLEGRGILTLGKREVRRETVFDLYASSLGARDITLNEQQRTALKRISLAISSGQFSVKLLHGVTGSGKTQVYIEAIRETLSRGKTAIVLVPEISLTPQIVRRFRLHFGEKIAAVHSRMSLGERYDTWRAASEGKCSVVIGPRSAVLAPLRNIGLIVVDEEHEASYKQYDQAPRYHARDVAIIRAQALGAVVVLGSATPAFESYMNAIQGKYELLELPDRVDGATLPRVEIIDMTEERKKAYLNAIEAGQGKKQWKESVSSLSRPLMEKINDRLAKREGIIILQNRRGYSPYIECPDCGHVEFCENCNITLTYHLTQKHLRCHYCGRVRRPPDICPECGSIDIEYRGYGTQRVEQELRQNFPSAKILRMDLDTTSGRGRHDAILREFSEGEADILLGTQMVAKGLDFSRVTLVGVISADTQMLLPDFRSAERTFQLLTQVAGRAGRSALAGEVLIQTHQPDHYALRHVLAHDYGGFYREEMEFRKELHYPPYSRLALIELRGPDEQKVIDQSNRLADLLRQRDHRCITLGPATAAIPKLRGQYRWHIVLKSVKETDPGGKRLHRALSGVLKHPSMQRKRGTKILVDIDPAGMM